MQTSPPTLDLSQEHTFSQTLSYPSLISSHSAHWRGMYLEFHHLPPLEVPEYTYKQHLITIPTKNKFKVEQKSGGKKRNLIFHPGELCIEPGEVSRQYRWKEDFEAIQLSFEPNFINHVAHELIHSDRVELVSHPHVNDPLIYQMGWALKTELEQTGANSKLYADSAATVLAVHLLRHYTVHKPSHEGSIGGLSVRQLREVNEYIHESLEQEISLDAIAQHIGLSRYYFCRLFKQSTGLSPYQYVIQCRVERAKQLLIKGHLTIAEVAATCGFSHQSHLHRHFKRLTGLTPKKFLHR